MFYSSTKCWFK